VGFTVLGHWIPLFTTALILAALLAGGFAVARVRYRAARLRSELSRGFQQAMDAATAVEVSGQTPACRAAEGVAPTGDARPGA
jgi:hypothetical protein